MNVEKLVEELKRDEGCVLTAYQDHLSFWTIGYGRMIDKRKNGGISQEEAEYLLQNDIKKILRELDKRLPWFLSLPDGVQRGLANMNYQMGIQGLLGFKTMLLHVANGDYKAAGKAARQSLWFKQTPERASRVIALIEAGK